MNRPSNAQSTVKLNRALATVVATAIAGVCQFCVFTAISMVNYRTRNGEPYSITEQYLSFLGATDSNVQWMFNLSLMALGFVLIPFFVVLPSIDKRDPR